MRKIFRMHPPVGNPAWWAEAAKVAEIPTDQLPIGPIRDTLAVLAAFGECELYKPIGGSQWNIWFETPKNERVRVRDWVSRVEADYR
jgi:hypothetical protein